MKKVNQKASLLNLSRLRYSGDYQDGDIANMDHTFLPFVLTDEKTNGIKSVKEVWAQSGLPGLEKRQVTVQLIIFTDDTDKLCPI